MTTTHLIHAPVAPDMTWARIQARLALNIMGAATTESSHSMLARCLEGAEAATRDADPVFTFHTDRARNMARVGREAL
jgi:hypothetical protein